MAFKDEHAPSIGAKLLLSASILAGILIPLMLMSGHGDFLINLLKTEKVEGNIYREPILATLISQWM